MMKGEARFWTEDGFVDVGKESVRFLGPTPEGDVFIAPIPLNAHVHLLDSLIGGTPPRNIAEAVVPPNSYKHRGIGKLLESVEPGEFIERLKRRYPHLPMFPMVEFREGGARGAAMGRLGDGHVLLCRPEPGEEDVLVSSCDGYGLSGIDDHPEGYVERCADACRNAGKPLAIHVSESRREDLEAVLSLSPSFVVHMIKGTERDLCVLSDQGLPLVICPRTSQWFGNPVPVKRMLAAGVTLLLGTDNGMVSTPYVYDEIPFLTDHHGVDFAEAMRMANRSFDVLGRVFDVGTPEFHMYWATPPGADAARLVGRQRATGFCRF